MVLHWHVVLKSLCGGWTRGPEASPGGPEEQGSQSSSSIRQDFRERDGARRWWVVMCQALHQSDREEGWTDMH